MIVDMASSLSTFRMQLSDDPDDWCWGRWMWSRPGALPLGLWTAYGHPLWETDEGVQKEGPRFILEGGVYSPSRVSPQPGLDYRGRPEWFEHGLPAEFRRPGPVGPQCGGESWDSEVLLSVVFNADDPILTEGGEEEGGEMEVGMRMCFPLGCRYDTDGGESEGGEMEVGSGFASMAGGEAEGGEMTATISPADLPMEGGGEEGGEMEWEISPADLPMEGGEEEGGEMEWEISPADLPMEGGEEEGGEMDIFSPPPPLLINARVAGWSNPNVTIIMPTASDGDEVFVMVVDQSGGALTATAGWTTVATGTGTGVGWTYLIQRKTKGPGFPSSLTFTGVGGFPYLAALSASVANAGTIIPGLTFGGDDPSLVDDGFAMVNARSLRLWLFLSVVPFSWASAPTPVAAALDDVETTGLMVGYQQDMAAGDPGPITATTAGDDWLSVQVVIDVNY